MLFTVIYSLNGTYAFAQTFTFEHQKVNLNVGDETTTSTGSSLGGLEPSIQWQTGGSVSGVDFSVRTPLIKSDDSSCNSSSNRNQYEIQYIGRN